MWLLPPDFPADAFDLPPGTWALPWYADEQHIAALMRLLVAGEARIREWVPLPWAALEDVDAPVRAGAALVLHAPPGLTTDEIVTRAQALPWPYVFWCSSRPALEGEGAWLEREIKRGLLSELHRSLLDPGHPLARFHVERLPLERVASMVGDPVDLLEIAQAAILHRLQHARDGLRKQDFDHSVRWVAGRRLGDYLLRIPEEQREQAVAFIRHGGRGQEDRAIFRRIAQAIQDVGLGLLVGEDLALGPLARNIVDQVVSAGVAGRLPGSPPPTRVVHTGLEGAMSAAANRTLPSTRITLPTVELTTHELLTRWILQCIIVAAERDTKWNLPLAELQLGLVHPRRFFDTARTIGTLATIEATLYQDQRLRELFSLILATFSSNQWDISRTRNSATALIPLVGAEADVGGVSEDLDASFVERALAQSPNSQLLDQLESESQARLACPQSPWLDATWHNISAEVARLQGRSATALSRFDAASHQWAAMELDGRTGWLQARVSAACAAYEAMKLADSERTLGTVATEVEDLTYDTVFAMVPLLRGMIAIQRDARALAAKDLEIACERFRGLGDLRGEGFTRTALAECHIHDGDLARTALAEDARRVFGRLGDTRGRTYAELVLGDAALLGSRVDEARAIYLEAIRLSEYGGDKLARGTAYHKLANLETHVRRHDVALTLERKALEIERAIGHDTLAEQTERAIAEIELLAASTPPDT